MRKAGILFMLAMMSVACVGCDKKEEVKEPVSAAPEYPTKEFVMNENLQELADQRKDALTPVPSGYLSTIEQAGTVTTVQYEATQGDGTKLTKTAYVYLPYGYDESKKYDIIYCLHGGEGNTTAYLGTENSPAKIKKLLDSMIANGDIKPLIAVAPTYYSHSSNGSDMGTSVSKIEHFTKYELVNELIPAVEGKYSTYAETTDLEGIKASRDHRAYTGFSMGSLSTWYTFLNSSDYFHYFMPMSGDCWVNGVSNANASAATLEKYVKEKGYGVDDFFIYAVTGSEDIAYAAMDAQIKAMKSNSHSFKFISDDDKEGNISYRVEPKATHDYNFMPLYFYNALPMFFK